MITWLRCLILDHDWAWFKEVVTNGAPNQNAIKENGAEYKVCKRCDKIEYTYY